MQRHLAMERWSQGSSSLHARDARAKLAVLLAFLIVLSSNPVSLSFLRQEALLYAGLLLIGAIGSKLPIARLLLHAAFVLPFSSSFAALAYWSGDGMRALAMLEKSYLSALAAVLFIATTPLRAWTLALEQWHFPRPLILVMQFLFRYLFVVVDQAGRMSQAAELRRGPGKRIWASKQRFTAAGGAVAVLFARSWQRADGVYRAMLARGFSGQFHQVHTTRFRRTDAAFVVAGLAATFAVRLFA